MLLLLFFKDNKGKARDRGSSPWSYSWVNLEVMVLFVVLPHLSEFGQALAI